jgi:hypothetical protein
MKNYTEVVLEAENFMVTSFTMSLLPERLRSVSVACKILTEDVVGQVA